MEKAEIIITAIASVALLGTGILAYKAGKDKKNFELLKSENNQLKESLIKTLKERDKLQRLVGRAWASNQDK